MTDWSGKRSDSDRVAILPMIPQCKLFKDFKLSFLSRAISNVICCRRSFCDLHVDSAAEHRSQHLDAEL